jgi:bifunctional non-homologous end joining protein LigD
LFFLEQRPKGYAYFVSPNTQFPSNYKNQTPSKMQNLPKATTLYFREGSSDKIYQVELVQSGEGWKVNFAFGRRGDTLQAGGKTAKPQPYAVAHSIYLKLLTQKLAKGYTPGESGVPFQDTAKEARNTGIIPQLLNPIEDFEIEAFLENNEYFCQEKFDGKRILIRRTDNQIQGINRAGLVVPLPQPLVDAAKSMTSCVQFLIDGELLGNIFLIFDLLEQDGEDLRQLPYSDRLEILNGMPDLFGPEIGLVKTAKGPEKRAFFNQLKEAGKEGCVFKSQFAPYSAGRPASGGTQRKYKFYETASFLVTALNNQRSVSLSLYNTKDELVPAGNVTIPPNFPIPAVGDIVEARFLYAYRESGSIYQPVFLGKRDDIPQASCSTKQLKYKS